MAQDPHIRHLEISSLSRGEEARFSLSKALMSWSLALGEACSSLRILYTGQTDRQRPHLPQLARARPAFCVFFIRISPDSGSLKDPGPV